MSVCAVVTSHNYARYLRQCLTSAFEFCDEVRVYDDGSTDDSLAVIAEFPDAIVTTRKTATGDPVWGSNLGIKEATTTHLIFLDADNWLISKPRESDYDYLYYDLFIANEQGSFCGKWTYSDGWPSTGAQAIERFKATPSMPVPWGGVWNCEFLRGKEWIRWPHTGMAADFRTVIEWMKDDPRMNHCSEPFMVFRSHDKSWSASPERTIMEKDAAALRDEMCRD